MMAIVNIPEGESQTFLSFRNATDLGLQDIILLQPGYDLASKSNISEVMLAHLSRFMDWIGTNSNSEMSWEDTPSADSSQHGGSRCNPWQTIPFSVSRENNEK